MRVELSADREHEPRPQRRLRINAASSHESGYDPDLAEYDQQSAEDRPFPDRRKRGRIETHADTDEEQAEKHVAERPDVRFHLMSEFRLAQHHSRQEASEGERQAQTARGPRREERHQQYGQGEKLEGSPLGHQMEQRAEKPASNKENESEGDDGFADRYPEGAGEYSGGNGAAQNGNHYDEWDGSDILKHGHCETEASVGECSSRCSDRRLAMIVVDDCAKTAPNTNAAAGSIPADQRIRPTSSVVKATCPLPRPST